MISVRMVDTTEVVNVTAASTCYADRSGALTAYDDHHRVVAVFAAGHWSTAAVVPTRDARGRFAKAGS